MNQLSHLYGERFTPAEVTWSSHASHVLADGHGMDLPPGPGSSRHERPLIQQFHRITLAHRALHKDGPIDACHALVRLRDLSQEFRRRFSGVRI
jgi:hypothetical protein